MFARRSAPDGLAGEVRRRSLSATCSHPSSRDYTPFTVRNAPKPDDREFRSIVGDRGAKRATARWPQRARQLREANQYVDGENKAFAHANAIMLPFRAHTVPEFEVATHNLKSV